LYPWALAFAGFILLPFFVSESLVFLTTDFLIMALFAMSYNLLLGQLGLLSFGHAAFYGIGAYTVALLLDKLSIQLVPAIFFAPLIAGLLACIIGFFTVRLSGFYFAILTMGFAQLVHTIVFSWYDFTGGDNGLLVVPPKYLLPTTNYYYFTLVIVALCIALLRMITRSPFGAALRAIRETSVRASSIGINVYAHQFAAFIIAGAFAGVAGGLRGPLQQMAFPSLLFWTTGAEPLLMTLAGGVNTFVGPICGAAFFVFINFAIASRTQYSFIFFGFLVLALTLFLRGGIFGFIENRFLRRREAKQFAQVPINPQ
jgi:branched-chain amino acid transport system permease protein